MTSERPDSYTHPSALDIACAPVQSPYTIITNLPQAQPLDCVTSNQSDKNHDICSKMALNIY